MKDKQQKQNNLRNAADKLAGFSRSLNKTRSLTNAIKAIVTIIAIPVFCILVIYLVKVGFAAVIQSLLK